MNIIQLELDKDLFQIEMKKQPENYNKVYQKLNFLNFHSTTEFNKKCISFNHWNKLQNLKCLIQIEILHFKTKKKQR